LILEYQQSIRQDIIELQVETFIKALSGESGFEIHRY